MKKRGALVLLTLTAVLAFSGCKKEEKQNPFDYVSLGQYKGVEISLETSEVTEEEVDARIATILKTNQEFVEVDRSSLEGDQVNISVTGEIDGKINDGFTSEGYDILLGSDIYVMEGFVENLYDRRAGEQINFTLTIPASFQEQAFIGKEITFHVTVNSVKEAVIPELNDEFVAKVSEYSTVDEYKEYIKEGLIAEKEASSENYAKAEVLAVVMENANVIKFPEGAVEKQIEEIGEKYNVYATLQEMTVDEYIQENFGDTVQAYAEELVKQELVLEAIQKEEKLTLSDAEYKEKLPVFAELYSGMDAETFESNYGEETIKQAMLWDKSIEFLVENAIKN